MNCPHWLLALTIPFSRSDRAHTSPAGVGAGCAGGLLRTNCFAGESPSAAGGPWEGRSDGNVTIADARPTVNASWGSRSCGHGPGFPPPPPIVAGHPPSPADARPNGPVPAAGDATHQVGMRKATRPPACHPALEAQLAFRFRLSPTRPESVRRPLMPSIHRMSPPCDGCMMNWRCCTAVTGP
jgi:hypothetical protein